MHHKSDEDIQIKRLIIQSLVSILLVVGLVFALAFFFREPLVSYSANFVNQFGALGLFFGMLLSDSLPAFVPPDAFLVFAIGGNMSALETILSMSVGSILGGSLAYLIGKYLIPKFKFGRLFVLKFEDQLLPYMRKYGFWAVVIAALTPVPYSWMAYTVGTFRMTYLKFFLGSLFRFVRMSVYYFAIYFGWVTGT
ncbi:putative cytoplasmic membrane protein [Leptospira ryugenii]|uniref:Putative cytoplasmic membrane protein n=1 Tax=Leptospira ryugenii TaxID=1917863 RepID=A0A2P2DYB3_9LEPT|nr:VTT domain-containing protein [Leptospira ryugenii]GBF49624.1 putative cytoplasmic membrane protein [Leptospira ryugenii]